MINQSYDEDLSRNDFFLAIQNYDNGEVFRKAVSEGWSICVPRQEALQGYSEKILGTKKKQGKKEIEYNQQLLLRHILIPIDELPESHFRSLDDTEVRLTGNTIRYPKADTGISYTKVVTN